MLDGCLDLIFKLPQKVNFVMSKTRAVCDLSRHIDAACPRVPAPAPGPACGGGDEYPSYKRTPAQPASVL